MIAPRRCPHNRHAFSMLAATVRYRGLPADRARRAGSRAAETGGRRHRSRPRPAARDRARRRSVLALARHGPALALPRPPSCLRAPVSSGQGVGPVGAGTVPARGRRPGRWPSIALLAATQYPWNRVSSAGEFLLDPLVAYDTAFHVGLVRELTLGYPPQVPGVSGFPLGYHLGHRPRAGGRPPLGRRRSLRLVSRFRRHRVRARAAPGRARRRGAPRPVTPWAVALVPVGRCWPPTSRSRSRSIPQAHWWADLLRGNLLLSLALANPVVPALALALGALVALSRAAEARGRGWWLVASVLAVAVPFFKVFLGAHLALGLLVAFARTRRRERGRSSRARVDARPLALVLGQGGQTVAVTFGAARPRPRSRARASASRRSTATRLAGCRLLWLVASLGLRLARPCGRTARAPRARRDRARAGGHGPGRLAARASSSACRRPRCSRGRRRSTTPPTWSSRAGRCSGSSPRPRWRDGWRRAPSGRLRHASPPSPCWPCPSTVAVRDQEGDGGARSATGADGPRHARAGRGQPARRRGPAAAGRALSACARHPHRPARAVRALHAVAHPVRARGGRSRRATRSCSGSSTPSTRRRPWRSPAAWARATSPCTARTACASTPPGLLVPRPRGAGSARVSPPALTTDRRGGGSDPPVC